MDKKLKDLENWLASIGPVGLAYSGGVDSAFLLAMAVQSSCKIVPFTVASAFVPLREVEFSKKMAQSIGADLVCLDVNVLENADVIKNDTQRCYYCKTQIFKLIKKEANARGITTLMHGVNLDDLGDFRPGLKASKELGFIAPLADFGFTKADIRQVSKQMGLATWDKPSQSCLATRIPHGRTLTSKELSQVEQAENFLHDMGFDQVRVRHHGDVARIEVVSDRVAELFEETIRQKISARLKELGFVHISVDMDGYSTGKMN